MSDRHIDALGESVNANPQSQPDPYDEDVAMGDAPDADDENDSHNHTQAEDISPGLGHSPLNAARVLQGGIYTPEERASMMGQNIQPRSVKTIIDSIYRRKSSASSSKLRNVVSARSPKQLETPPQTPRLPPRARPATNTGESHSTFADNAQQSYDQMVRAEPYQPGPQGPSIEERTSDRKRKRALDESVAGLPGIDFEPPPKKRVGVMVNKSLGNSGRNFSDMSSVRQPGQPSNVLPAQQNLDRGRRGEGTVDKISKPWAKFDRLMSQHRERFIEKKGPWDRFDRMLAQHQQRFSFHEGTKVKHYTGNESFTPGESHKSPQRKALQLPGNGGPEPDLDLGMNINPALPVVEIEEDEEEDASGISENAYREMFLAMFPPHSDPNNGKEDASGESVDANLAPRSQRDTVRAKYPAMFEASITYPSPSQELEAHDGEEDASGESEDANLAPRHKRDMLRAMYPSLFEWNRTYPESRQNLTRENLRAIARDDGDDGECHDPEVQQMLDDIELMKELADSDDSGRPDYQRSDGSAHSRAWSLCFSNETDSDEHDCEASEARRELSEARRENASRRRAHPDLDLGGFKSDEVRATFKSATQAEPWLVQNGNVHKTRRFLLDEDLFADDGPLAGVGKSPTRDDFVKIWPTLNNGGLVRAPNGAVYSKQALLAYRNFVENRGLVSNRAFAGNNNAVGNMGSNYNRGAVNNGAFPGNPIPLGNRNFGYNGGAVNYGAMAGNNNLVGNRNFGYNGGTVNNGAMAGNNNLVGDRGFGYNGGAVNNNAFAGNIGGFPNQGFASNTNLAGNAFANQGFVNNANFAGNAFANQGFVNNMNFAGNAVANQGFVNKPNFARDPNPVNNGVFMANQPSVNNFNSTGAAGLANYGFVASNAALAGGANAAYNIPVGNDTSIAQQGPSPDYEAFINDGNFVVRDDDIYDA